MELEGSTIFMLVVAIVFALLVFKGVKIVPQQQAWIVEKLGRYDRKLEPGLNFLIPYIERASYRHGLKEQAIDIHQQAAITKDNVTLNIDGVLYVRITDAVAASYGVQDPYYALTQLAQTTMRSEIGKITMDKTFEEREMLNTNIVNAINEAASSWGIQCMRYEIKDIEPPSSVLQAMELQVAAERQKRAEILESEGKRQAQINVAEGEKQEVVLTSEAAYTDQVNRAKGEAEAILAVADATAKGVEMVAASIQKKGGSDAVSLRVAEQYVGAFKELAQESNTILLPANVNDAGSMIAQAMTVFDAVKNRPKGKAVGTGPWDDKS